MSQKNVEIVRRAHETFNRAGLGPENAYRIAAELLHPEVEWHDQRELPGATVHHGIDEVVRHLASAEESVHYDPADLLEIQEDVDVVRRAWRADAEGGLEAELAFHAPDAVYEDLPEMADRASYRGREGFIERSREWRESSDEFQARPLEFIDAGDGVVVVPVATTGLGKGSGVPIESRHVWVIEVRDGKIVRERAFRSKAEALEAAGLRE